MTLIVRGKIDHLIWGKCYSLFYTVFRAHPYHPLNLRIFFFKYSLLMSKTSCYTSMEKSHRTEITDYDNMCQKLESNQMQPFSDPHFQPIFQDEWSGQYPPGHDRFSRVRGSEYPALSLHIRAMHSCRLFGEAVSILLPPGVGRRDLSGVGGWGPCEVVLS